MTFDPRAAADELRGEPVTRMSRLFDEAPESYFHGEWSGLHPLNVPGPFYGAETDTCCDGPPIAPDTLLCDHQGYGFVWRQPRTAAETHALMSGASSDPFAGYGWDGDSHWTPALVRAWWEQRTDRQPAVDLLVEDIRKPLPVRSAEAVALQATYLPISYSPEAEHATMGLIVTRYLAHLGAELEHDLERYLYFLEHGTYPSPGDRLPSL